MACCMSGGIFPIIFSRTPHARPALSVSLCGSLQLTPRSARNVRKRCRTAAPDPVLFPLRQAVLFRLTMAGSTCSLSTMLLMNVTDCSSLKSKSRCNRDSSLSCQSSFTRLAALTMNVTFSTPASKQAAWSATYRLKYSSTACSNAAGSQQTTSTAPSDCRNRRVFSVTASAGLRAMARPRCDWMSNVTIRSVTGIRP
ncbi:Uncharacterised protein [Klebsiella pneumoniae]|nr:hypothetical protein AI2638V1_5221 [Klebsiella pneumoniae]CAH3809768.1 hypothetical protein AI2638V1_5221 [Klebsiella pneumoniae]SVK82281.1 Uncharacterised protein [Klebsiella pneumoniae]